MTLPEGVTATFNSGGYSVTADLIYDDSDGSYLIESVEDLQALADYISAGTFEGNGYTITTDKTLFNYTSNATISNLTIDDCAFVGTLTNATNGR